MRTAMNNKKLLKIAICSTVFNKGPEWSINGTNEELQALSNAMQATKQFTETINNENTTSIEAMRALKEKHSAARNFEVVYGIRWPL
jgi:hypothetical protein